MFYLKLKIEDIITDKYYNYNNKQFEGIKGFIDNFVKYYREVASDKIMLVYDMLKEDLDKISSYYDYEDKSRSKLLKKSVSDNIKKIKKILDYNTYKEIVEYYFKEIGIEESSIPDHLREFISECRDKHLRYKNSSDLEILRYLLYRVYRESLLGIDKDIINEIKENLNEDLGDDF